MRRDVSGLWVVIPAFNEAPVIGAVVTAVRAVCRNVIVVDDCSTDDTGRAAREAGAVMIRHPINLGQGAALQSGICWALRRGAAYVVTFDADGQHRPEDIGSLLDTHLKTGADVILGNRFLGNVDGIPRLRRMILRLAIVFTRVTSGLRLSDAHNGLRLLTRQAAERLRIRQNRMAHASELINQIGALKLTVAEAPVTVLYTEYSLGKGQRASNALNILMELFVARLRE